MSKEWLYKPIDFVLKLMHLTCRDISPVISEMMNRPISPKNYWRVRIHLAVCIICRYYKTQLKAMTRLTYELANKSSFTEIDTTLCPESKIKTKKPLNPGIK